MALSSNEQREIEVWTGELLAAEAATADDRLRVLDHTLVVAYEILRVRLSGMIRNPDELRLEGDARVRWVEAKGWAQGQVRALHDLIINIDPPLSLNSDAKILMDGGSAATGQHRTKFVPVTWANPRP